VVVEVVVESTMAILLALLVQVVVVKDDREAHPLVEMGLPTPEVVVAEQDMVQLVILVVMVVQVLLSLLTQPLDA
jgi:hypothetical protein